MPVPEALAALDTHIVLWLFENDMAQLSPAARQTMRESTLVIPAFVRLEIVFLGQKKRLPYSLADIEQFLNQHIEMANLHADIVDICQTAYAIDWTRDPFDRLIVAEAKWHAIKLITKDRLILKHYAQAVW